MGKLKKWQPNHQPESHRPKKFAEQCPEPWDQKMLKISRRHFSHVLSRYHGITTLTVPEKPWFFLGKRMPHLEINVFLSLSTHTMWNCNTTKPTKKQWIFVV